MFLERIRTTDLDPKKKYTFVICGPEGLPQGRDSR